MIFFFFFQVYNYEKLFKIMNLNHYWTALQWLNLSPVSNSHRSGINGQCFSLFWQYLIADSDCSQGSGSPDSFTPLIFSPLLFKFNVVVHCNYVKCCECWVTKPRSILPCFPLILRGMQLKISALPTVCLQKKRPKMTNIPFKLKSPVNVSKITYHTCRIRWTPSQCVLWFSTLHL